MQHLTQTDLSRRWRLSPRTLEAWRWHKQGPAFLKVGGRILYRLEDVLAYEVQHLKKAAATNLSNSVRSGASRATGA